MFLQAFQIPTVFVFHSKPSYSNSAKAVSFPNRLRRSVILESKCAMKAKTRLYNVVFMWLPIWHSHLPDVNTHLKGKPGFRSIAAQLQHLANQPNGQTRMENEQRLQRQKHTLQMELTSRGQELMTLRTVRIFTEETFIHSSASREDSVSHYCFYFFRGVGVGWGCTDWKQDSFH